jgi:hypothetical protein
MKTKELQTWSELKDWLGDTRWKQKQHSKPRFAFRGQADSGWPLQTSLARHFSKHLNDRQTDQWRTRELKMYQFFRERLLQLCPDLYDKWDKMGILALMQHYGARTRMLDFTYCQKVAAWFALKDAQGSSAVWIVDRVALEKRGRELGMTDYCGPDHDPEYKVFNKEKHTDYRKIGFISDAQQNERLAAQKGCFFVVGSISNEVDEALVYEKVIFAERITLESRERLWELGSDQRFLPNLSRLGDEAKHFAVAGGEHYPIL